MNHYFVPNRKQLMDHLKSFLKFGPGVNLLDYRAVQQFGWLCFGARRLRHKQIFMCEMFKGFVCFSPFQASCVHRFEMPRPVMIIDISSLSLCYDNTMELFEIWRKRCRVYLLQITNWFFLSAVIFSSYISYFALFTYLIFLESHFRLLH